MTVELFTSYEMRPDRSKYKERSYYETSNEKTALTKNVDNRDFYIRIGQGYLPVEQDQYLLLNDRSNLDAFSSFIKVDKSAYDLYLNYISFPSSGNYAAVVNAITVQ